MVVDHMLIEQRRIMAQALIYELMRLPLADPTEERERIYISEIREGRVLKGIPERKIRLAESIAMWALYDDTELEELEGVRRERIPHEIRRAVNTLRRWIRSEASKLPDRDRNDILGFFEIVSKLKYPNLDKGDLRNRFRELLDEVSLKNQFVWSLVINSSKMDVEQLKGGENESVRVGVTPPILGRRRVVDVRRFYPIDDRRDVLLIGEGLTRGGGAGWDNTLGLRMAVEDEDSIRKFLDDKLKELRGERENLTPDVIMIVYASGGGTGSGSAPVVAKVAKEIAPPFTKVMAIAMTPMPVECRMRAYNSVTSLAFISEIVDGIGIVSLEDYVKPGMSTDEVYKVVDTVVARFLTTFVAAEELNIIRSSFRGRLWSLLETYGRALA